MRQREWGGGRRARVWDRVIFKGEREELGKAQVLGCERGVMQDEHGVTDVAGEGGSGGDDGEGY